MQKSHARKVTMRSGRHVMKIAIPLLLFLLIGMPGCTKKSDAIIEGTWTLSIVFSANEPVERVVKFKGDDESGSVYNQNGALLGSYSLTNSVLKFSVQIYTNVNMGDLVYLFTGALSDDTHMGGTLIGFYSNFPQVQANGVWTGTK